MKKAILITMLFFASFSYAGTQTITWTHDLKDINQEPSPIDRFRIYWGNQTASTVVDQIIEVGSPLPAPISTNVDTGRNTYRLSMAKPEWVQGSTVCYEVTAIAMDGVEVVESDRSNRLCKKIPVAKPKRANQL